MRARSLLLTALILLVALPAAAGYAPPRLWFVIQDLTITESSGVAASSTSDSIVFTHNDSGDTPRFFAVRTADGRTASTFGLGPTVRQAIDFEDMARGPGSGGGPALFLADIGNNTASEEVALRPFVTVYEVPEPPVDATKTGQNAAAAPSSTMHLVYEDGAHNAEALMVDPGTGALVIVTKVVAGVAGVYVGEPLRAPVQVMRRVASIDLRALGAASTLVTGGDLAPDGSSVVVRTYSEAFEWTIPSSGLGPAFASAPQRVALPQVPSGEAIAYTRDGSALFVTQEGSKPSAFLLARAS